VAKAREKAIQNEVTAEGSSHSRGAAVKITRVGQKKAGPGARDLKVSE